MDAGSDFVQILIDGLLDVERGCLDPVNVVLDVLQRDHPLFDLPGGPNCLDAIGRSLLDDLVDWQLRPTLPPLVSFEGVFDGSYCRNSLQEPLEEEDHLLVFVDVHLSIEVEHIKADRYNDVEMRWLEDQKVLVLVLEDELVDERILLQAFQLLLELLHVEVAASIRQDFQSSIGYRFIVTEDEVPQGHVRVRELVRRQRLIVLHFEVSMDRLGELYQWEAPSRKHVWLSDSDGVVLLVFLQAVHQVLKLDAVLVFKEWHKIFDDLDEDGLLLLQDVETRVLAQL